MGFNLENYEPVEERIDRFYNDCPDGRILTEIAGERDDFKFVIFKASVFRSSQETEPAATGFAYEVKDAGNVNRTSHIENCETSAIGRALANLNYAAKGKRASREEMTKASAEARPAQPTSKTRREVSAEPVGGSAQAEPKPTPASSQKQDGSPRDSGEEGSDSPPRQDTTPASPGPSSSVLIEEALKDKRVKPGTLAIKAMKAAQKHDVIPAEGINSDNILQLPTAVLDEVVDELGLRQEALV